MNEENLKALNKQFFSAEDTDLNADYYILWRFEENCSEYKIYAVGRDNGNDDLLADGYIKWDGCSNWWIGQRDCMLHICDPNWITDLHYLMLWCYEKANEHTKYDPYF